MKYLSFYKTKLKCQTKNQVFNYLIQHLKPSNKFWEYFVNWNKVFERTEEVKAALNKLNSLIGAKDFDQQFKLLIKNNPEIIEVIPALIVRDGHNTKKFMILDQFQTHSLVYQDFVFSQYNTSNEWIEKYLYFVKKTGLKNLIVKRKVKNLVDFMLGIEAGLDSNARKNRSGHWMEDVVESFIKDICETKGFQYLKEANALKIKHELDYIVPVDKASRRYDFVIDNRKELFIIETNFYGTGGSKLKSTAGEYRNLFNVLRNKYKFIWITDGTGWLTAQNALQETFGHNDYLFTLALLEQGILSYLIH